MIKSLFDHAVRNGTQSVLNILKTYSSVHSLLKSKEI